MSSKCDCDYFFTMSNVEHALHKRIKINIFHKNWFEQEITVLGDWVPSVEGALLLGKCFRVYSSLSINGMFTFEWKEVMVEIATVIMITICYGFQDMWIYQGYDCVCVCYLKKKLLFISRLVICICIRVYVGADPGILNRDSSNHKHFRTYV
jgi:hypothetical protein